MSMRVEIYAPTADELRHPSLGDPLIIRGRILDALQLTGIDVSFDGKPATVVRNGNGREWTASAKVRKSGDCTIWARSYFYSNAGPEYSPGVSLTVVVAPTQWQLPITFEVDGSIVIGAAKAIVNVGPKGKLLAVRVNPAHPRKSIEMQTSIDTYTKSWPLSPTDLGRWSGEIMLPAETVPHSGNLVVREFDFFNQVNETVYNFSTVDVTPPTITITEPSEDQVFVVPPSVPFPFKVTFRGSVSDNQSNYMSDTLKYSFAGQNILVPPENVGNGGLFFIEIQVTGYGPYTLTITAKDNSDNQTPPVVHQFELVSNYKPKTIEDLLAPRSYLDALLRFIRSHILNGASILKDNFLLDFGMISEPGSQVGGRRVSDLLLPVALLRKSLPPIWKKEVAPVSWTEIH